MNPEIELMVRLAIQKLNQTGPELRAFTEETSITVLEGFGPDLLARGVTIKESDLEGLEIDQISELIYTKINQ